MLARKFRGGSTQTKAKASKVGEKPTIEKAKGAVEDCARFLFIKC